MSLKISYISGIRRFKPRLRQCLMLRGFDMTSTICRDTFWRQTIIEYLNWTAATAAAAVAAAANVAEFKYALVLYLQLYGKVCWSHFQRLLFDIDCIVLFNQICGIALISNIYFGGCFGMSILYLRYSPHTHSTLSFNTFYTLSELFILP